MELNRTIFREYDIRGIAAEDLRGDIPYYIGRSFGTHVARQGKSSVCAGGDNRSSTPEIKEKLIRGLKDTGCNVTDIGIVPTPVLYFSTHQYRADAGIMVTASHNPPEFNGFKMVAGKRSLHGGEIQDLADRVQANDFETGNGILSEKNAASEYADFIVEAFRFKNKLRVGVDTGNGTLGPLIVPVFNRLGLEIFPLYTESDPTFPNHPPDPLVAENLEDLIRTVRENKLAIGLGYDGDGDRLGGVDETGKILWGDQLMIIFARAVLEKMPGSKIIFDVKCSRSLEEEITKAGGIPVMWKTGHSLIENKMHAEQSPLAGELSGHIYFADEYFGYDDALYASLRLLKIMDDSGMSASGLLAGVKQYHSTPEIRIDVADDKKFALVDNIKKFFYETDYRISDIDGVKVFLPEGWALVRASNTQPAVVVRMEAESPGALEKIKRDFMGKIQRFIETIQAQS